MQPSPSAGRETSTAPPRPTATPPGASRAEAPDRWAWRARIRADPRKRAVYRTAVGVLGGLLVLLGLATGWLPGPGGIPLVLAGLAVLASEFAWARRLLHRARVALQRFTHWAGAQPRWLRWAGSGAALVAVLGGAWLSLAVLGAPAFLPAAATAALERLPGVGP